MVKTNASSTGSSKKSHLILYIISALAAVLVAGLSVWAGISASASVKQCAAGNTSRTKVAGLLSTAIGKAGAGGDRSALLAFYDGWSLNDLKDNSPSMQKWVGPEVNDLQKLNDPITRIVNPEFVSKIDLLVTAYKTLLNQAESMNRNPWVAEYIDSETAVIDYTTEKINLDFDRILHGLSNSGQLALNKIRLDAAVSMRDKYSEAVFTDALFEGLTKATKAVSSATSELAKVCAG